MHQPPTTWREDDLDGQLGQMLFYAVAQQLKALKLWTYPRPLLGIFMAEGKVFIYSTFCAVICFAFMSLPFMEVLIIHFLCII